METAPTGSSALAWLATQELVDDPLPADLSHEHDHYLYGTPKRGDGE